ncbi:unnamed protein product [Phytophthora fragariaefolia]|uniref:Unnamed protein product n=1 Tax=Phytophthora fragariaefolia TaxID=1490495 RepID=A0A9W6XYS2_9STRA|nr:unnamed protein product [Phytophthora fragariaefolia]
MVCHRGNCIRASTSWLDQSLTGLSLNAVLKCGASESQETSIEATPSGSERRVHSASNDDDEGDHNDEKQVGVDGDEVMGSSTGDGEAKENSGQLNSGVKQSGSLNAVYGTLNAGDEASATHSLNVRPVMLEVRQGPPSNTNLAAMLKSLVLDFLGRESQVTVSGNWKRFQELFGHFVDGTKPPAGWITNIHVPEPWFSLNEEYNQDGLEVSSSSSSGNFEYEQVADAELDDNDAEAEVTETGVPAKQTSPATKRQLDMLEAGASNQEKASTPRRSPRTQLSKTKQDQSGPAAKKARLATKVIEQPMESPRKATRLARILFQSLTIKQMSAMETPDPAITTSYRWFGIEMCFYQKKSKPQTLGFPNYAPQKCDMEFLDKRWSMESWVTIFAVNSRGKITKKLPWNVMFAERTKLLYYHDASKLSSVIMLGLKKFVEFMEKSCQLDDREPARTLWATAANEVERTQYVSNDLRDDRTIPLPQRAHNWIVPDRADNELDDEDDEDEDEASEVDNEYAGNGDEEEAEEEEVEEGDTGEGDQ